MSGFDDIDGALNKITDALETAQAALSRMGDYVLELLAKYVETFLRFCRRIAAIVYRFLRDLFWNCLKIAWQVLHLGLIVLFFGLLWCAGNELWRAGYPVFGVALETVGLGGFGLFTAALLASLGKRTEKDPTAHRRGRHLFWTLDILGVLIVGGFTVTGAHQFENTLLRRIQLMSAVAVTYATQSTTDPTILKIRESSLDAINPPLRAGRDIRWPMRTKAVEIKIPAEARVATAFGTVDIDMLIGRNGKVRRISKKSKPLPLDAAVITAAAEWEYESSTVDGVERSVVVPFRFRWAGDEVPGHVLTRVTGSGAFKSKSLMRGTISNASDWTIGLVQSVLKGPKAALEPVRWVRYCDTREVLLPGASIPFECSLEPVDVSEGFRWTIQAWGLAPK